MAKLITRKEAENRRLKFRVFAGMIDFLGTIGSVLVILACVLLLISLWNWIISDGKTTFASIIYSIKTALLIPE